MGREQTTRIQLVGGLGSQLGGYFFGRYLEIRHGHEVVFDTSELDRGLTRHGVFVESLKIPGRFSNLRAEGSWFAYLYRRIMFAVWARIAIKHWAFQPRYHTAKEVGWSPAHETLKPGTHIRGEFFTSKYFLACKEASPDFFDELTGIEIKYEGEFRALANLPFLAIHVRRGDYMRLSKTFGILGREYFENALNAILNSGEEFDRVLVFSDDPLETRALLRNLVKDKEVIFIEGDLAQDPIHSFLMMSRASLHIISNSSYSLWAALLSSTSKMIVAPEPWFRNLDEPCELIPDWVTRVSANFLD